MVLLYRGDDMDENMEKKKIDKSIKGIIQILEIVQDDYAMKKPLDNQKISDYDAISQSIECLKEYTKEAVKRKFGEWEDAIKTGERLIEEVGEVNKNYTWNKWITCV